MERKNELLMRRAKVQETIYVEQIEAKEFASNEYFVS